MIVSAISEHVENAGRPFGRCDHRPPAAAPLSRNDPARKKITRAIVKALQITGPFNIQFIAKDNAIQVIECNVRASRSFPFVSKVTGHNFIEIAIQIILGKYKAAPYETLELDYVGVKTPQFSYHRLKGADPVAHVEMASTGEVACLGGDFIEAFLTLGWQQTKRSAAKKCSSASEETRRSNCWKA